MKDDSSPWAPAVMYGKAPGFRWTQPLAVVAIRGVNQKMGDLSVSAYLRKSFQMIFYLKGAVFL